MHKVLGILVVAAALAGIAAAGAAAAPWAESGDAGNLPGTAQVPNGSGALTTITGVTGATDADMYKLCLTGGRTFSATTIGSQLVDTQLFLFDATGLGVEANDDGGVALKAVLPAGGRSPLEGGAYYLAVSSYNNDPLSAGGLIFPSFPYGPVYGPTGPGGGQAITGWTGAGFGAPAGYTIALTGARFCLQEGAALDIKPGSAKNPVNLGSRGVIPVTLLSGPDFDAATVDLASVDFEGATEAHGGGHLEDVDGDGDEDLVLHFRTQDTGLSAGDTAACLTATTTFGESISACDAVTIRP